MVAGLNQKFNILDQSPYDCGSARPAPRTQPEQTRWVPSRYNIRATSDEGHLVLWNTLSGAISVFSSEQAPLILTALRPAGFEASKKGMTKYLVDRGFLRPSGTDEYRQFQHQFNQQQYRTNVLQFTLMPSEDCNFRCNYCYEDFARGTMLPEVREGIKNLVHKRVRYLDQLMVSWFGGEPLYGWEAIEDLAPFFAETAKEHDLALTSNMTTNGYLLTPDKADKLIRWGVNHYQITLDGRPEDHDRNRPTRDGGSSFWTIYDNLKELGRRPGKDFTVTLRVNVDPTNAPHMDEFLDLLRQDFESDDRIALAFQPVNKWGGDNDDNLDTCGEDSATILRQLQAAAQQRGFHLDALKFSKTMGSQVCYAARPYQYLIGAAGQVMKCTILLDKDPANVVGHLTPEGELKLDQDKFARWTEPAFEKDTQCQKCVLLPNCGSAHCPLPRIQGEERSSCVAERSAPKKILVRYFEEGDDVRRQVVHGG